MSQRFEPPPQPSIVEQVRATVAGARDPEAELEEVRRLAERHADLNAIAFADWTLAARRARALKALDPDALARLRLAGVLVSVKDLFQVEGLRLEAGTRATLPPLPAESAVAQRLAAAGAIVFAKTNMHEIALGATGENPFTGDVKNPWDPSRQAGGSSSGAAVAVACGIGAAGIGSDTGGSVRIPAAFCGIVGFKPSFGAIPLDGALPLSWTCDHAGPLTRTVADAAVLFEVLSRRATTHAGVPRRPRLGVPHDWLRGRLEPRVREAFEHDLRRLGGIAEVVAADVPSMPLAWRCYTPIVRAEAAFVHRDALAAGARGFSDGVLAPLEAGRQIGAGAYFDAMQGRATFSRDLDRVLGGIDAMLLPSTAILPPPRGQQDAVVEGGTMSVREAVLGQTLPFSFAGVPTLSLPAGFVDGLPRGLQLVGRRDGDASLLALGGWLEGVLTSAPS
ncbi:MAG: amidase [Lautropia sp.]